MCETLQDYDIKGRPCVFIPSFPQHLAWYCTNSCVLIPSLPQHLAWFCTNSCVFIPPLPQHPTWKLSKAMYTDCKAKESQKAES